MIGIKIEPVTIKYDWNRNDEKFEEVKFDWQKSINSEKVKTFSHMVEKYGTNSDVVNNYLKDLYKINEKNKEEQKLYNHLGQEIITKKTVQERKKAFEEATVIFKNQNKKNSTAEVKTKTPTEENGDKK